MSAEGRVENQKLNQTAALLSIDSHVLCQNQPKSATEVQKFFVIAEDFKVISGFSWKQRKNIWLSLIDGDNKLIANDFHTAISAIKTFFLYGRPAMYFEIFFFKSDSRTFVLKISFSGGNRFTEVISYHF